MVSEEWKTATIILSLILMSIIMAALKIGGHGSHGILD